MRRGKRNKCIFAKSVVSFEATLFLLKSEIFMGNGNMVKFTVNLAGIPIEISAIYDSTKDFCKGYFTDEEALIKVATDKDDILFERQKALEEEDYEKIPHKNHTDANLETLAVYRKIAEKLIDFNVVLFHGCCVSLDGVGYLFTAKSGTGKTTHAKFWLSEFSDRAFIVNGDKPLIKLDENGATCFGSPWRGKENFGKNTSVPLKYVCVIKRDTTDFAVKTTFAEQIDVILSEVYRPKKEKELSKTLSLLDMLYKTTDVYEAHCTLKSESAKKIYSDIKEGKK